MTIPGMQDEGAIDGAGFWARTDVTTTVNVSMKIDNRTGETLSGSVELPFPPTKTISRINPVFQLSLFRIKPYNETAFKDACASPHHVQYVIQYTSKLGGGLKYKSHAMGLYRINYYVIVKSNPSLPRSLSLEGLFAIHRTIDYRAHI